MAETGLYTDVRWEWDGTQLAADAAIGADTITVRNGTTLSDVEKVWVGGTGPYHIDDVTDDTVTFESPDTLTANVGEGEPVVPDAGGAPHKVWVAECIMPDADEPIEVPLTSKDLMVMPPGAANPAKPITLSDDYGSVIDLPGTDPVFYGGYTQPGTQPAPILTDGNPPTSSPTPEVIGFPRSLMLKWPAIINADFVEYEVHIATSNAAPPDASTLVIDHHASTLAAVDRLPDGSGLVMFSDPPTNLVRQVYYVAVWAKDDDGLADDPSPWVSAMLDPAKAVEIDAEQIRGIHLESVFALLGQIVTATSGARIIIDSRGIELKGSNDETRALLPTDILDDVFFRGRAELDSVTILDLLTMRGVNNVLASGTTLTLAGKVNDPKQKPTPAVGWNNVQTWFDPGTGYSGGAHGLAWDGSHYWSANLFFGTQLLGWDPDGTSFANCNVPLPDPAGWDLFQAVGGVTYIAGETAFYVLGTARNTADWSDFHWHLRKYTVAGAVATLVQNLNIGQTGSVLNAYGPDPAIGSDGTNPIVVSYGGDGHLYLKTYDPDTLAQTSNVDMATGSPSGTRRHLAYVEKQNFDLGASRIIIAHQYTDHTFYVYNGGTYARISNEDFPCANSATILGAIYNPDGDITFRHFDAAGRLWDYTANKWTTASSKWWAGFTWEDTDATGGTHETGLSSKASFTMTRRARLTVTMPTIPDGGGTDDPDSINLYLGAKSTTPTDAEMFLNDSPASGVTTSAIDAAVFSGTSVGGLGLDPFPDAAVSKIVDASGNTMLDSAGRTILDLASVTEQTITDGNTLVRQGWSGTVGAGWEGQGGGVYRAKVAGTYVISAVVTVAGVADANRRFYARLYVNANIVQEVSGTVNINRYTSRNLTIVKVLAAGDDIKVEMGASGADLTTVTGTGTATFTATRI